tara:strand:+ start:1799 stop:2866 length:1068 start_codon:yes stop_codon:yes gene_type:complete
MLKKNALKTLLIASLATAASALSTPANAEGPFEGIYDYRSSFDMEPAGTVFSRTLYDGYSSLSLDLRGIGNSDDTELFNHKALLAGKGSPVQPDAIADRELFPDERVMFQEARFRLFDAYHAGAREFAPGLSATAQVSFDCWIEAVEDQVPSRADLCRDKFYEALSQAEAVSTKQIVSITISPPLRAINIPPEPAPAPVVMPEPEPEIEVIPQAVLDQYLTVPFEFDKTTFAAGGEDNLRKALNALNEYQSLDVHLIAHADRSGSAEYNQALSKRRADAVLTRLMQAGIDENRIKIVEAVGESQPLVPTEDGVRLQENRVVELDLRQEIEVPASRRTMDVEIPEVDADTPISTDN